MALTDEQLVQVLQKSMFDSQQWIQVGRNMAQGMSDKAGFSSHNTTGQAGGRGVESKTDETYRKYEGTLKTEIKLRKLSSAASEGVYKTLKEFDKAIKVAHPEMKTFARDMSILSGSLDTQFQNISDRFSTSEQEIAYWSKRVTKAGNTIFKLDRKVQRINATLTDTESTLEERKDAEEELIDVQKERAELLRKTTPDLKAFGKKLAVAVGALAGVAAVQMGGDIEAMRRFGTPGGMFQQLGAAQAGGSLMGIDPQLISELMASNRATVIAMGGASDMGAYYDELGSRLNELANITGNRTEALKFEMEAYQSLLKSGIMPTTDALNSVVSEFNFFHEAMGMTSQEFLQMRNGLIENVEIRRTLQGIDKKDRHARVSGIITQIQTNREMGMMRDQAIRAATALQELGAKGPVSRMKQMAKLQAVGAMAGVQMSDEVRQAFIRGRSATDEQRKAQSAFMGELGAAGTNIAATMGGTGMEFAFFGALDKAGISMSDFDTYITTLGEEVATLPQNFEEGFQTMIEQMGPAEEQLNRLKNAAEAVSGVFENVAGGGFMSNALSTGVGAFLGTGGFGKVLTGIKGLAAAVPAIMGTNVMATVGAAGLGAAGVAAGIGGAVGGAAGYGVYKATEGTDFGLAMSDFVGKMVDGLRSEFADNEELRERAATISQAETDAYQEEMLALNRKQAGAADKQVVQGDEAKDQREKATGTADHAARAADTNARAKTVRADEG